MSILELKSAVGIDDRPVVEESSRRVASHGPRLGAGRRFLLICGPFGKFTSALGQALRREGAACTRVILNAGDILDWGLDHTRLYRGGFSDFGAWLSKVIERDGVTDVIIYGDSHPYCGAAKRIAEFRDLRLHVLEQGYFRPFWVTLERGGVNGSSVLPRDPDFYRNAAASAPDPVDVWLPPLTPKAARNITLYHAALLLGAPAFSRFHEPYAYSILHQGVSHVRRFLHQRLFRARHAAELRRALTWDGPIFFGVLQRPGDSQIRIHSPYQSVAEFIDQVVASFAAHAPANARLVFKSHPLDHGIEPHRRSAEAAARAYGAQGRVFFLDTGDLHAMVEGAAGAVTINSTAGLSLIAQSIPTITLGEAIYDMKGLTHQGGLERFWVAPERPDLSLYRDFRKVVIARTQVAGAYADDEGVQMAVGEITRRLLRWRSHPVLAYSAA